MWRVVIGQVARRRGRSLAVVGAIVVASVSFSLLTSAVATSQLQVHGIIHANYRSAYDILVRPPGSRTRLERRKGLVRQNFLSDIFGGITIAQWHQIEKIPGVQVAAPVAMIGYDLPSAYVPVDLTKLVSPSERQQVFSIDGTWRSDRGLTTIPDSRIYAYVWNPRRSSQSKDAVARGLQPCYHANMHVPVVTSPFSSNTQGFSCLSTANLAHPTEPQLPGRVAFRIQYPFPMLIAAIDPIQEAKLVGLNHAVTSGRYLREADRDHVVPARPGASIKYPQIPVLMPDRTFIADSLTFTIGRAAAPIGSVLSSMRSSEWPHLLPKLPFVPAASQTYTSPQAYRMLLGRYTDRTPALDQSNYWSVGTVKYQSLQDGRLRPLTYHNPVSVWSNSFSSFFAPRESEDLGFRKLTAHQETNVIGRGGAIFRAVGVFNPSRIRGFSALSRVPLSTYNPPAEDPGTDRSERLLHGKSLLPNGNLAGYLQQPPMMLTTIKGMSALLNPQAYGGNTDRAAPISVIRVRVAGVTGVDPASRARVRLAAQQIIQRTGLDVDITMGSSTTPELIDLPAGRYGRPPLTLREGWVKKGVDVTLLSAVDTKSLALFGLVLVVCLLFLINATVAALRSRRPELGVLACLGWPAHKIFSLLELELAATGLAAGVLGAGLAAALITTFGLDISWFQIGLILPVAVVLAALSGIGPVWKACRASPMEAITPAVRPPRRGHRVNSVSRLAVVGLTRWPGRTALGALSLFVGTAALTVLIAVQQAFQGRITGTLLGDYVAVQVRAVDYLAAAMTIGLGAFAVADVTYLNIYERTAEIGTLRSVGWGDRHVRRLFGLEGIITALVGATSGAVLAIIATAILLPVSPTVSTVAALASAAAGILAAAIALLVPLARVSRLAPATALSSE